MSEAKHINVEIGEIESKLSRARYQQDRYGRRPVPSIVYGIYDARYTAPFYIGFTRNLEQRALGHSHASEKPVRIRTEEIETEGSYCVIRSIAQFYEETVARFYEKILIATLPGLVNLAVPDERLMVVPPSEMGPIEALVGVESRRNLRLVEQEDYEPEPFVPESREPEEVELSVMKIDSGEEFDQSRGWGRGETDE